MKEKEIKEFPIKKVISETKPKETGTWAGVVNEEGKKVWYDIDDNKTAEIMELELDDSFRGKEKALGVGLFDDDIDEEDLKGGFLTVSSYKYIQILLPKPIELGKKKNPMPMRVLITSAESNDRLLLHSLLRKTLSKYSS
jgi:hypothetical protein